MQQESTTTSISTRSSNNNPISLTNMATIEPKPFQGRTILPFKSLDELTEEEKLFAAYVFNCLFASANIEVMFRDFKNNVTTDSENFKFLKRVLSIVENILPYAEEMNAYKDILLARRINALIQKTAGLPDVYSGWKKEIDDALATLELTVPSLEDFISLKEKIGAAYQLIHAQLYVEKEELNDRILAVARPFSEMSQGSTSLLCETHRVMSIYLQKNVESYEKRTVNFKESKNVLSNNDDKLVHPKKDLFYSFNLLVYLIENTCQNNSYNRGCFNTRYVIGQNNYITEYSKDNYDYLGNVKKKEAAEMVFASLQEEQKNIIMTILEKIIAKYNDPSEYVKIEREPITEDAPYLDQLDEYAEAWTPLLIDHRTEEDDQLKKEIERLSKYVKDTTDLIKGSNSDYTTRIQSFSLIGLNEFDRLEKEVAEYNTKMNERFRQISIALKNLNPKVEKRKKADNQKTVSEAGRKSIHFSHDVKKQTEKENSELQEKLKGKTILEKKKLGAQDQIIKQDQKLQQNFVDLHEKTNIITSLDNDLAKQTTEMNLENTAFQKNFSHLYYLFKFPNGSSSTFEWGYDWRGWYNYFHKRDIEEPTEEEVTQARQTQLKVNEDEKTRL